MRSHPSKSCPGTVLTSSVINSVLCPDQVPYKVRKGGVVLLPGPPGLCITFCPRGCRLESGDEARGLVNLVEHSRTSMELEFQQLQSD